MQITTLNKVINLVLVGTFALVLGAWLFFDKMVSYFGSDTFIAVRPHASEAIVIFAIALALLSVTMCLGLIVDAIANLVRGFLKKHVYESDDAERLLMCLHALQNFRHYREQFNKLFRADAMYRAIASETDEKNKSYAVAIFFQTAKPEHVEWTLQHYSMYVLATSYFTLLLLCLPVVWCTNNSCGAREFFTGLAILALYLLLHSAIDRYFYVYENTYRHVSVLLSDKNRVIESPPA